MYSRLLKAFGPQHWWPADSPFEVMVGAILTQQTNWKNVEKAVDNLKKAKKLSPRAILSSSNSALQKLVRPSGYYRQKARKLKIFCKCLIGEYDASIEKMKRSQFSRLRTQLLSLWGIGRETADSILLYALGKPIFVVDAYTVRIGERVGLFRSEGYEHVRQFFESSLRRSVTLYKEYHALLVELGKKYCKPRPLCSECPVKKLCVFGRNKLTP
jgi:endonuclease-3 related protein